MADPDAQCSSSILREAFAFVADREIDTQMTERAPAFADAQIPLDNHCTQRSFVYHLLSTA